MSYKTNIEWADATWNPIVGCSKCSPGCKNCYAEKMAVRLAAMGKTAYKEVIKDKHWNGKTVMQSVGKRDRPLEQKKPRRIFVCSMGDLFHESVPDEWINIVLIIMARNPQHTFLLLTKRAQRMHTFLCGASAPQTKKIKWPLPNVHIGVTVCTQDEVDEKIPLLLGTPAARCFISVEPMLEEIDLSGYYPKEFRVFAITHPDHVICGGESGPNARPLHPEWVRSLRDQCVAAGTPFLFKQWGEWWPAGKRIVENRDMILWGKEAMYKVGKKAAGRELDGEIWDQYPEKEVSNES
jgi:protein gp37